jgi:hypothetical protein
VVIDWSKLGEERAEQYFKAGRPSIFVTHEPSVVHPRAHQPDFLGMFSKTYRLGHPNDDGHPLQYPIRQSRFLQTNPSQLVRAAMVNTNLYSVFPGELYSLRRKLAQHPLVDTFGLGWRVLDSVALRSSISSGLMAKSNSVVTNWRGLRAPHWAKSPKGKVVDKLETLSRYRATLAIENSIEYTSEKLIDPIVAGSIPVYVGSSHVVDQLPKGLVFLASPSLESVSEALQEAMSTNRQNWLDLRADFEASSLFQTLSGQNTYQFIVEEIRNLVA